MELGASPGSLLGFAELDGIKELVAPAAPTVCERVVAGSPNFGSSARITGRSQAISNTHANRTVHEGKRAN